MVASELKLLTSVIASKQATISQKNFESVRFYYPSKFVVYTKTQTKQTKPQKKKVKMSDTSSSSSVSSRVRDMAPSTVLI
jgi:hypothetical protein